MYKYYSLDFKQHVLKQYKEIKDINCIIMLFKISKRTLFYWLSKEKINKLNIKPNSTRIGKPYKIDINKLDSLNKDNKENYTLKELGKILSVTSEAIRKYFIKNNITFKKKDLRYYESDSIKVKQFQEEITELESNKNIGKNKIIYIDETGIDNKSYYRKYGWSKRGETIYTNDLTGKQFPRTTIIDGLRNKEPISLLSFIGTTDTEMFEFWVENCLCPELKEGDVVIMDNARKRGLNVGKSSLLEFDNLCPKFAEEIHKSATTRKLIESKKALLKFQPPYSPFLNKIENYWGFIKKEIGLIKKNYEKFDDCIKYVFNLEYGENNCNMKFK